MHKSRIAVESGVWRHLGTGFLHAAVLALLFTLSLPARAGDDRAVKSRVAPVYPELAKRMKSQAKSGWPPRLTRTEK